MSRLQPEMHPLLTEDIVEALRKKQVFSVVDLINTNRQQIAKITQLKFKEVLAVKNFLLTKYSARPINGFDYYKHILHHTAIIPTGIESVDSLLDGGLLTGNIYEICGAAASGKTQFALTLTKTVVQDKKQKMYFLDTKNDFSPRKIRSMMKGAQEDEDAANLSRIMVKRTYTKWDLINSLYEIKNSLEQDLKLRLIVIDSLPAVLLNSNDYVNNNAFLNHLVNVMRYIALEHHVAFLITNLITTWSEFGESVSETIGCGKYWLNIPNVRLKIEKADEDLNVFRISLLSSDIVNSQVKSSVNVVLTEKGFRDFKN